MPTGQPCMQRTLIIAGASTRAAAQSALHAGFVPWCVDLFGDRDLQAIASVCRIKQGRYPHDIPNQIANAPRAYQTYLTPVLFTGAMENHLSVIKQIAKTHALWGASIEVLKKVREPRTLASLPAIAQIKYCQTYQTNDVATHFNPNFLANKSLAANVDFTTAKPYLIKPKNGAGGLGIRPMNSNSFLDITRLSTDDYLQQYIQGKPISAIYHNAQLLGVTEQIIGDKQFGASPFAYAGSIGPISLPQKPLTQLGEILYQKHQLKGVYGIDLIYDLSGVYWPIEINPRYTASMEVIERAGDFSVLNTANQSIQKTQKNKAFNVTNNPNLIWGKAVLFAKENITTPHNDAWLEGFHLADIPHQRQQIAKGKPICSILVKNNCQDTCLQDLHNTAQTLYTRLL